MCNEGLHHQFAAQLLLITSGCSVLDVSGFTGSQLSANGAFSLTTTLLYAAGGVSCGSVPVFVQQSATGSRAVVISNRNLVLGTTDSVVWAVFDDASSLIGLEMSQLSALALGTITTIPGLMSFAVDNSARKTAFSSLGPNVLTGQGGMLTIQCGL
jgi:hypothetical protein